MAIINGTSGPNNLFGTVDADEINGLGGNDYILHYNNAGPGSDDNQVDTLNGGDGNDIVDAGRNDIADGGTGFDRFTVYYAPIDPGNGVTINLSALTTTGAVESWFESQYGVQISNFETFGLTGTNNNDIIYSFNRAETGRRVFDGTYNITIEGFDGDDTIYGGVGIEEIYGGNGNDSLYGGDGADVLVGGAGNDLIDGGNAAVEEGNYARFDVGTTGQSVTIDLAITTAQNTGEGMDTILNIGNILARGSSTSSFTLLGTDSYNNFLSGGDGADTLNGRSGDDRLQGNLGADSLIGGTGWDEAIYEFSNAGVNINLATNVATGGHAQGDTFNGVEYILGSAHADTLTGDAQANRFMGGAGDDTMDGGLGNDNLIGGVGADTLNGGDGNDTLWQAGWNEASADTGVDILNGGAGNDNIVIGVNDIADGGDGTVDQAFVGFYDRTSGINLDMSGGAEAALEAAQNLTLTNFEYFHVFGSAHADTILGSAVGEQIAGAEGNDTLNGGGGNDTLLGMADNDVLNGGAGNDSMRGGLGDDTYYVDSASDGVIENAGEGTDHVMTTVTLTLTGNVENLTLLGSSGISGTGNTLANVITGNSGNNTLNGGDGNDTMSGGLGSDTLFGGNHNDVLNGEDGDDFFRGGPGDDILNGGEGNDVADYASATGGVTVDLRITTAQNTGGDGIDTLTSIERLQGSAHADTLTGSNIANLMRGAAGNDVISALGGDDTVYGDAGNDEIIGSTGIDTIYGGHDNDTLRGDADNDFLYGENGDDVLRGGAGNDFLNGGSGFDRALYTDATSAVTVNLANLAAQNTGGSGTDTLTGIEHLTGSDFDDTLTGDGLANTFNGGHGLDTLVGGAGDDVLMGEGGNDVLSGGLGNDLLNGGTGDDTVTYADATSGVNVTLYLKTAQNTGGAGTDTLVSVANLTGSAYGDDIVGTSGVNIIDLGAGDDAAVLFAGDDFAYGGAGADNISGGVGNDTVYGGDHNDLLKGNQNDDTLYGDAGNDVLKGGDGIDTVYGGDGDDNIQGEAGIDTLWGGAGADRFVFSDGDLGGNVASRERIRDFNAAEGDQINLRNIDANTNLAGDQNFTKVGAFTGTAGEYVWSQQSGYGIALFDTNGDGTADLSMRVDGSTDGIAGWIL